MKLRGTFLKLFLDNLVVMIVILALVGTFTYHRLDANYQRETREHQDRLAHLAKEHLEDVWPLDRPGVDRLCKRLLHDASLRLTVIATDGTVLGDSEANPLSMRNHKTADRPEVLSALEGESQSDDRRSDTLGIAYRYMAMPLMHQDRVVGAVRVAMPVKTIADGETMLLGAVLWSALAGTLAALVLGLATSWIWYAPLRRITEAARQIASGNLASKPGLHEGNRLADLAGSLDQLRDHLGKYLAQIASQHQDFQTVLANLQEGVIATDVQGRIVLINQAACELFSVPAGQTFLSGQDTTGTNGCSAADPRSSGSSHQEPLQAVVPVLGVLKFHEQVMGTRKAVRGQIEVNTPDGRRTIEIHGTPIEPGPSTIGCLLVVRDVTDLATAAAMKAQFVANASHELRTPLATIRVAVDSLTSTDPGDADEVAKLGEMLDRHVTRLEDMTKDLLDLHMVESARFPLRWEDIPLGDLAEWVMAQFAAPAQEKGVSLSVSSSRPERRLRCDRKLLELILRNLVDNAVKFTSAGGSVQCTFEESPQGFTLCVRDTGCGISPEDQPRVFERFYQGDASRSGKNKARGTGLGLAIVKHAADRLDARVSLVSRPGQGTTMSVFFRPSTLGSTGS